MSYATAATLSIQDTSAAGSQRAGDDSHRFKRLGEILLEQGKISARDLETALGQQEQVPRPLGAILVEMGRIAPDDVAHALSLQLKIPFHELGDDYRMEWDEVGLVPEPVARRYCLIPIRHPGPDGITLVMGNPVDIEAIDTVRSLTDLRIHKAVSSPDRIVSVIERFYRRDAHIERELKDIIALEADSSENPEEESGVDAEQLLIHANDAPVVRFVNLVLMEAVRDGASDIHFEPGEKNVRVRLRLDGRLTEGTPPPKSLYPAVVTRIKILANLDIAERRLPQDGRFRFTLNRRVVDVRVSSLPEVHGEKIVLRILDRTALRLDMEEIGFRGGMLARFRRILHSPHGIILLTGPTGSGKTTTLYSALSYIKNITTNIQTVEDPVEYQIDGINQMQIKPEIGLDFARALRSILRQDPDILLVGEMRDLETAQIAIRSSLTGHLVLSTLHTNDATSAISRLRDIGVPTYLIAATIKLVIAQRLVRTICPDCREPATPHGDELAQVVAVRPDAAGWDFYHGAGCKHCRNTGFRGRRAVFEFLEVTEPIREMIHANMNDVDMRRRAVSLGMQPLPVNGFELVKEGVTTLDEIIGISAVDGAE